MGAGGCGAAAGDGNVVDDWKPVADAKPLVPPNQVCYDSGVSDGYAIVAGLTPPVACTESHAIETFHVGQLPADLAAASDPPKAGSPEYQRVFAECETAAREFLGDDWFNGRLRLLHAVPRYSSWLGGARHYRCDLVEIKSQRFAVVKRTGSLRDSLKGDRPLANTCYMFIDPTEETVGDLAPIGCDQPHDAEYAGVFDPGGAAPPAAGKAREDAGFGGCRPVVVRYLGATGLLQVGYMYWGFSTQDWERGDKRVRCYATAPTGTKLKGSVKGIGNRTPPTA